MSSMLEQAIIDAKALKESAIKNAEALVVEKYSDQIKSAVATLLEQEDEFAEDPFAEEDPLEVPPPGATPDEVAKDPVLGQVPTALDEDVPGVDIQDDTTVVEIDLPDLLQKIEQVEEEEGIAVEPGESHEELAASPEMAQAAEASPLADSTLTEDEEVDINIDESLIDEIVESLVVDIEPKMRGWAGTPQSQMEEYEDMALARENDDEVKEENEALRSKVEDLEESLNKNKIKNKELAQENGKFREAVIIMKEKIDVVNVSNAKLLYINKALENSSLNERQKRKIVEAISKAETTKEAKVIYETLQSTVGSTEKRSVPKSLSEAVSRKNTSLLINAQRNREKDTTDPLSERLQRLAGIKK